MRTLLKITITPLLGIVVLTVVLAVLASCEKPKEMTMENGLKITDITVGDGLTAEKLDLVTVQYTGTLEDGSIFDSSKNPGREPFRFTLGVGQVISGWDQGVAGMKVGGHRRLVIPPELGYGSQGAGKAIPPNAVLTFDVELLKVEK
ncbi:MAG: FKBP-type peptidyl-prolyl cis-trans isomerase [FCB group bacterium]|nr:FKBP-type peptidyl-prolyl cis-trans isomerase [FCB group bacterium]